MSHAKRRQFFLFAGALLSAPLVSFAQQQSGKVPRIGWLVPSTRAAQEVVLEEYRSGMRDLGYLEGRNVETEYLYADGQFDRLPGLAAELVAHKVDIIVTASTPGCLAAKQATKMIPIVFATSSDPISTGIVASLARPGGNITGLSNMASDLSAKRLELIHILLPRVSRMAALWEPISTRAVLKDRRCVFLRPGVLIK